MNETTLSYKWATPSDAKTICELGARLFMEAYRDQKEESDLVQYCRKSFVEAEIENDIIHDLAYYGITYHGKKEVGYNKLRADRSLACLPALKCIELERIYVQRSSWRHKVGKYLMDEAVNFARLHHYEYMWLGVWQLNHRANAFYKNYGFEIIGTKKFYVGTEENDDYVLGLNL